MIGYIIKVGFDNFYRKILQHHGRTVQQKKWYTPVHTPFIFSIDYVVRFPFFSLSKFESLIGLVREYDQSIQVSHGFVFNK